MKCEYCSKPFYGNESVDGLAGFMQTIENEPSCNCYKIKNCPYCGEELLVNEQKNHKCEKESN